MSMWADGVWIERDAPAAPISDRGFALGDGLFETILATAGALAHAPRHHARLAAGARGLDLPAPPPLDVWEPLALEALHRSDLAAARAAVRVVWTAGRSTRGLARDPQAHGALFISATPAPAPTTPASVVVSTIRRNETSPTARWKTLSYLDNVMARREAEATGADEALLLNTAGRVACAAAATVIAVIDGALVTPPVAEGALPGITRARLLEAGCGLVEQPIPIDALARASGIALANALIGVRPAMSLDGRPLDPDLPVLAAVAQAISAP